MPENAFAGCVLLVVEDEYMIAMALKKELVRSGAAVVGPAASVENAIALIESTPRIDGAILDVSLQGEMVFPVADLLRARGVPFLLATGYDQSVIPHRFSDVVRHEKPIGSSKIGSSLLGLLQRSE